MVEILVIFLLVWLWIIERRLRNLRESVQSIKLDAEGIQTLKYRVDSEIADFRSELGDLLATPKRPDEKNDLGLQPVTSRS